MRLLKGYLSILDFLSTDLAAKQMYSFMSNPRLKKLRAFENTVLDESAKGNITFNDFNICTYTWGEESDKVALMIHGWEGQAGNFGGLVPLLLENGYQVIAFDAPSHGYSSKGKTNMFHFVEVIETFITQRTPNPNYKPFFWQCNSSSSNSKQT